jgi:pimeloyl-ACP methyl ester carboxylesterase
MQDVIGILDALGLQRVHLVGHDWGGVLAWLFASRHPERLQSLAVCNAPHPVPFQERLLSDPAQREASAYLTRLQAPGAGRGLLAAGGEALWSRLRGSGVGFDAEDRSAWLAHWAQPDALDGAVAWYRASPFQRPDQPDPQAQTWHREQDLGVKVPTLIIWGERDTTFVPALAKESAAQCQSARVVRLADVHHNPPREASTACAEALASFWKTVDLGSSAIDE